MRKKNNSTWDVRFSKTIFCSAEKNRDRLCLLRVPCGATLAPLWLTRGAALALPYPAVHGRPGGEKKHVWRGACRAAADSSGVKPSPPPACAA